MFLKAKKNKKKVIDKKNHIKRSDIFTKK